MVWINQGAYMVFRKVLILVLILLLSSLAILAQEDESNDLAPDANACNEGGAMAGKCNIDFDENGVVDDYEIAWAWTCGWYIARYNAGIISRSQVPVFCSSLLPAEVESEAGDEDMGLFCYILDGSYYIFPANPDGTRVEGSDSVGKSELQPDYPPCDFGGNPL
jgi:hypothetical protein